MAGQAQPLGQVLIDYWTTFVTLANDTPPPSATTAREHLQAAADQVSDTDADAFFLEVAQTYQDMGLTAQNTYIALRNEVKKAGETISNNVMSKIIGDVRNGPAGLIVSEDLLRAKQQAELDWIPTNIATVETDRDLQSDQVLIDAYDEGIVALNKRAAELRSKKGVI